MILYCELSFNFFQSPRCKICSSEPIVKSSNHLFLDLPKVQPAIFCSKKCNSILDSIIKSNPMYAGHVCLLFLFFVFCFLFVCLFDSMASYSISLSWKVWKARWIVIFFWVWSGGGGTLIVNLFTLSVCFFFFIQPVCISHPMYRYFDN